MTLSDIVYIIFFLLIITLVVITLLTAIIFFSPSSLKAAFENAPFVPTNKKIIRKALKAARLKPNEIIYDLGSGTGKAIVIAVQEFQARAVGIEYSTPLYYLSKLNLFLRGISNKKAKIYHRDFFEHNLSKADVIFIFLTPRALKKLDTKFKKELRPKTRIVVYSSPLPRKPNKIISSRKEGKIYLYLA